MKRCPLCSRSFDGQLTSCPDDGSSLISSEGHLLSSEDAYPLVGTILDEKYRIEQLIGRGGMGEVYLATQIHLDRLVAVKILHKGYFDEESAFRRFRREAMAAARINHRNVVQVLDFGVTTDTGMPYFVMEFVKGESLRSRMSESRQLSYRECFRIVSQICAAMDAAHANGIIHRDLKPENILLTEGSDGSEQVVVLDFGIAKLLDERRNISSEMDTDTHPALTEPGLLVGTPTYMSPEQLRGIDLDHRSDIYTLGLVMYEMLTGTLPFRAESVVTLMAKSLTEIPESLRHLRPDIPRKVEKVVLRALEKKREDRQRTAQELAADFEKALVQSGIDLTEADRTTALRSTMFSQSVAAERRFNVRAREDLDSNYRSLGVGASEKRRSDPLLETIRIASRVGTCIGVFWLLFRRWSIVVIRKSFAFATRKHGEASITEDYSQPEQSSHLTLHLRPFEVFNAQRPPSPETSVLLRFSELYLPTEEHKFEELILHSDYERLWRSLTRAGGGFNLITGYGPFGGTSLIQCAIEKARQELNRGEQSEAALLAFNFQIKTETKQSFEIEAGQFGLAKINRADTGAGSQLESNPSVINVMLSSPIGITFFSPPRKRPQRESEGKKYDLSKLMADMSSYFSKGKSNKELQNIVRRLVKSKSLQSRIVLIIDKVRFLETLESFSNTELFRNRHIRIIAVARKEDVDSWESADRRLEAIGCSKWYVPCLWKIDFEKSFFTGELDGHPLARLAYQRFIGHLEYKARGSLGNIISELRKPTNTTFGNRFNFIDFRHLSDRAEVQHNAWLQEILDKNWGIILGRLFGGSEQDEKTDRARIATYYLLDWIGRQNRFTREQLLVASMENSITISDDAALVGQAVENLVYALNQVRYLEPTDEGYRVVWNKDKPPKTKSIRAKTGTSRPRSKTSKSEESDRASPDTVVMGSTPFEDSTAGQRVSESKTSVGKQTAGNASPNSPSVSSVLDGSIGNAQVFSEIELASKESTPRLSVSNIVESTDKGGSTVDFDFSETDASKSSRIRKSVTEVFTKKTEVVIEGGSPPAKTTKILIVFANPQGTDPLRLGEEDRTIRDSLKRSKNRDNLEYKIIHAARIEDVQRELLENDYRIVHLSGHCTSSGQLAFEDANKQIKIIPQQALADLLSGFPSIECVILNSCFSVNQGRVIALKIPFTVAMDGSISDSAARNFTRGFYDALGSGKDYTFAHNMGCQAIALDGVPEESKPRLFMRELKAS